MFSGTAQVSYQVGQFFVSSSFYAVGDGSLFFSLLKFPLGTLVFLNPTNGSSQAIDFRTLAEKLGELGLTVGV
jgi:hypothetical protein